VKLVDRTFNCRPERSSEIFRYLMECRESGAIPPNVCFHFEAAGDLFDSEAIDLLRAAPPGLFQMEIGLQSFHRRTLEQVGRDTDIDRLKENFGLLREGNNIHLHLDLIAGLPHEGMEAFASSFDQAFSLSPHMLQLGFLKLLHGSRLREESGLYGIAYDPRPPYRILRTNWISEDELAELELCEDALNRLYNSGRFPATVGYMLGAGRAPRLEGGREWACGNGSSGERAGGGECNGNSNGESSGGAFSFFAAAGRFIGCSRGMALESYIAAILRLGETMRATDREALRDCLVMDWLQTNHVGTLPLSLQMKDPLNGDVGRVLERLNRNVKAPPELGTRRPYGFGLLYGNGGARVALADYSRPRPFLGNYPLRILEIGELFGATSYTDFT
jgi:hypothetical protein